MKKLFILILLVIACAYVFVHGFPDFIVNLVNDHQDGVYEEDSTYEEGTEADRQSGDAKGSLTSTADIGLTNIDGVNYSFTYRGEEFRAQFQYDCWTIYDSYKITDKDDMKIICQALIDVHPVHGKDMVSYRTADDMAYEWEQHNLAYKYLPEDNAYRESAGNVDLDPYDQGRTFEEIYEDRTGQEFSIKEEIKESIKDGTIFDKAKQFFSK